MQSQKAGGKPNFAVSEVKCEIRAVFAVANIGCLKIKAVCSVNAVKRFINAAYKLLTVAVYKHFAAVIQNLGRQLKLGFKNIVHRFKGIKVLLAHRGYNSVSRVDNIAYFLNVAYIFSAHFANKYLRLRL